MTRRLGLWLTWSVALVVLASLAAAAGPVAWHLLGWSEEMPLEVAARREAPPEPERIDIAPILALAPFGAEVGEVAPAEEIVETRLDLVLNGIFFQGAAGASTAFIGHEGVTRGYRVGDIVAELAEVVEIAEDVVLLEIDGTRQTLSFPDRDGAALSMADVPAGEEAEPELTGPERLRQMMIAAEARPEADSAPPRTTQDYIALWRERIRANPAQVLDSIGLERTDAGYRIAEDHDSGVARAGLLPGDVVTSVNGQPVGDVDRDRQLFDEVAASGLARLEIERGDRTIVLSFPLQ